MHSAGGYILIIDIGTTNCKSTVFAVDGTLMGGGKASYPEHYPQPGWVEQKPEDWWSAVVASVTQALSAAGKRAGEVLAIGVTGQMHGVVPIDKAGQPLGPCLTLRDRRAEAEVEEIVRALSWEGVYHITGARLSPSMPAAKIRWMRQNQPGLYQRACSFLPVKDYIRYVLTGDLGTEAIDAAGTLLYDVRTRQWSAEMADAAGVSLEKLPPLRQPWEMAGTLRGDTAQALGLMEGTPVIVGAGDDVECLGLGLVESGDSLEHLGTTGSIMTCTDRPVDDPAMVVELYPHVAPSLWLVGGSVNAAGGALEWASRMFSGQEVIGLNDILRSREDLSPSASEPIIFLPYLAGERCPIWEPAAKGAWFGLTLSHERTDLLRAVLEGVTFSLKHVLEHIEEMAVPVSSLAVQERPGENSLWLDLRATIYGRPLRLVQSPEPTSLGTMILAGLAIGLFTDVAQGVKAIVKADRVVQPDDGASLRYEHLYALYKETSAALRPLVSCLAGPFVM